MMSLPAGTRVGPYEILGLLGAGGMGEVYRARDGKLQRDVAIKVLPPAFAGDADRLARFEREAQVLAALNHPNIATIFGIEASSGSNAFVLELVEGDTLADVLAHGSLPIAEALRIATQVARALEAAHERGIIHRDLKPANIKLTRSGGVKVLDFGLAKLTTPAASPGPSGLSLSPTMTSPAMLTGHGIILGTAAYMSPEQARGKDVDRRTDIWAFGCVLFEMLTGRHAFDGESVTDVLARIIERDVDWALLPATTPTALRRLLRRCLTKSPSDRLRDAGDIVMELTDAAEELVMPPVSQGAPSAGRGFAAISLRNVTAIAVLLAVAVAATYMLTTRGRGDAPQPFSMEEAEIVQLTTTGRAERPAISPDGKYVVYVERAGMDFSLRLRQTSTTSTAQIVAPEPGVRIFGATVSPDGAFVDYVRDGATARMPELWRVPLLGGSARRLMTQVHSTITWSPDGSHFAFVRYEGPARQGELFGLRHSVMVGDRRDFSSRVIWTSGTDIGLVSFATSSALVRPPVWSPDGRRLAIAAADRESDLLLVVGSEGRDEKRFSIPGRNGLFGQAWLSDDDVVLNVLTSQGSATQLWHYSLSDSRARRLTHDVNGFLGIELSADRSVWVTSRSDIRVSLWIGDGAGTIGREVVQPMPFNYIVVERALVAWSGNQVFFNAASTRPESETGPGWRIAVFRVTPPDATALEVLGGVRNFVGMSSGEALLYRRACSGPCPPADNGLWRSDTEGGSTTMFLAGNFVAPVPTPDGTHLIHGKAEGEVVTPWIVEMSGGTPRQLSAQPGTPLSISRDGKRLLLNSPDGLQVCDLPACAERIPVRGGGTPRLLPDGTGVAYVDPGTRSNIWVQPVDGGKPYQLTRFTGGRQIGDFAWSFDGSRLAITLLSMPTDVVLLKGLRGPS